MKNKIMWLLVGLAMLGDVLYLALVGDSFITEYVLGKFEYWGYPQWGWMYETTETYAVFNLVYLFVMVILLALAIWAVAKRHLLAALMLLLPELFSIGIFYYLPHYNFEKQFAIFEAEKGNSNTRIPAGSWWVFPDEADRYDDASNWEKLKGYLGRGEWPGGYPLWGEYRFWLLPDLATNTLGRRGMVLHGGTKEKSPWGVNLGTDVLDMAIAIRKSAKPVELKFKDISSDIDEEAA